ncbi:MAG: beta-propeller domain-containing protein [Clostridium sp.]|nr:beta-propeller domain-containing protein [Clostridium sp.]
MKKDYDFIKDKFDKDGIAAPDSINEFAVLHKLENAEQKKIKFYQRPAFKAIVSAAACLAIAVGIFSTVHTANAPAVIENNNENTFSSFDSYKEIKSKIDKCNYDDLILTFTYDINIAKTASDTAVAETSSDSTSVSYGETYKQVDGVDEADIIKNDGRYIYYCNIFDSSVSIYDGDRLISKIQDFKTDERIYDIYVHDNTLVLNTGSERCKSDNTYTSCTNSYIYDLSSIETPKRIKSFSQSGYYSTSRMIGDQLYIVSNTYVYHCATVDDCKIYSAENNNESEIDPKDICYTGNTISPDYLIISSIDTKSCQRTAKTKALFGCGNDIYCNENNMYITACGNEKTTIIKATLSPNKIEFTAKADINQSYVNNQFSMDEYNGYFRIAVTENNSNSLYIFDDKLNKVGEVTGFAKDENIKAVKFMGDTAYVITYFETDPLFVIDLSNPSEPSILGEVEISGFSSQLVPIDENKILGIGYIASQQEDDSWIDGLKLTLFDTTDKTNPKVLDTKELPDLYSDAQSNHKAIVVNKEKGCLVIDYYDYTDDIEVGALTIEIEKNKINVTNQFAVKPKSEAAVTARCTYIGDKIYVIDDNSDIYSFDY